MQNSKPLFKYERTLAVFSILLHILFAWKPYSFSFFLSIVLPSSGQKITNSHLFLMRQVVLAQLNPKQSNLIGKSITKYLGRSISTKESHLLLSFLGLKTLVLVFCCLYVHVVHTCYIWGFHMYLFPFDFPFNYIAN